jgi:peptide/nickel transport system ATP-binding protein
MFQHVGVPEDFLDRYPFELSGGMRQRVAIAMSLVTSPNLIVLDEPTSALDVLTQANIFNVLKRIKKELGASFILITHDIATSSELADEVSCMPVRLLRRVTRIVSLALPCIPTPKSLWPACRGCEVRKSSNLSSASPPASLTLPQAAGLRPDAQCALKSALRNRRSLRWKGVQ